MHVVYFDGVPEVTVNGSKVQFALNPQVDPAELPDINRIHLGIATIGWPCPGVQVTELKTRKLATKPK